MSFRRTARTSLAALGVAAAAVIVAGCASESFAPAPSGPRLTAAQGRALVLRALPDRVHDRGGWAVDLFAAIASLDLAPTHDNVCAAVAVAGQESSFEADPRVPGLSRIAWKEIERRRMKLGIPKLVVDAALALPSSNGKSYAERIDHATTERELSDTYDDLIDRVPFGRTLFADDNPVRTAGPMQVSVAFAEGWARTHTYPYPVAGSIRHETFTRRGSLYFGVAHLLAYRALYDRYLYRFADYNAGRYASRNAAFQHAVALVTGVPLAEDGHLLPIGGLRSSRDPGATEAAVRVLKSRLDLSDEAIHDSLLLETSVEFGRSPLYTRVMALADRTNGSPVPRARVPAIMLSGPKISRHLTTAWYAQSVERRFRACLARLDEP
ncbi:MAG TPA: DUF1615 domain-containing protein [Casimicrobiaceae bacterium]|nr:DUF1615 domain-containing protein [Casimicrobiaceae bacterium]